jgi:hypothetical protein
MIEAFLPESTGLDVAVVIEDGECVAVLEHAGAFVGAAGRCEDVVETSRRKTHECV